MKTLAKHPNVKHSCSISFIYRKTVELLPYMQQHVLTNYGTCYCSPWRARCSLHWKIVRFFHENLETRAMAMRSRVLGVIKYRYLLHIQFMSHVTGAEMRLCAILLKHQTAILLNDQTAILSKGRTAILLNDRTTILLKDQNGIVAILN